MAGQFFGGFSTTGPQIIFSDRSIKTNINSLESATDLVKKLNPVTYSYKSSEYPELHLSANRQYGFIAQEVEAVIPELVSEVKKPEFKNKDGKVISKGGEYKGVNYDGLIPVLTKSIQEQQTEIETLKQQISELKEMVKASASSNQSTGNNTTNIELNNSASIVLNQNVPNPFAEQTVITYTLTEGVQKAQMLFYDANGKLINSAELSTASGKGQINVFANDLSTGSYTYTLIVDGRIIDTKKMMRQ
jgi:hypothetical protein